MYVRKENIPEENLDWGESFEKNEHSEVETQDNVHKNVIHPSTEKSKIVLQKKIKFSQINIKNTILDILDEHGEITFFLGILTLPYIIGFIVVSFILLYGNVPIDRFFSLKEGVFHFELWSIGAYISITVGVIWLVIMLLSHRR
jgi:hypothetical protein